MAALELIRDFVNTADLEAQRDEIADAAGLQDWLVRHRLADPRDHATAAEVAEAIALREALRELLRAHTGVDVDRDAATQVLDRVARETGLDIRFGTGSISFVTAKQGISGGLGYVVGAIGQAMSDGSWQRLKACRSDTCRWAFIDNARNRSRQWCDMAVCGNRAKARTFRRRHG